MPHRSQPAPRSMQERAKCKQQTDDFPLLCVSFRRDHKHVWGEDCGMDEIESVSYYEEVKQNEKTVRPPQLGLNLS
jgi:hypothetical protein